MCLDDQNSMFGRRMIWVWLPVWSAARAPEYFFADSQTKPVAREGHLFILEGPLLVHEEIVAHRGERTPL